VATASTRFGARWMAVRVDAAATGPIVSLRSLMESMRPLLRRASAIASSARCSNASGLTHFADSSGQPAGDGAK
jgi:hypothetical protein